MPKITDAFEQIKAEHPDAYDALCEGVFDRNMAPNGLKDLERSQLLHIIESIGNDVTVMRFTEHHARIFHGILTGNLLPEAKIHTGTIEAEFTTGNGDLIELFICCNKNSTYILRYHLNATDGVAAIAQSREWAQSEDHPAFTAIHAVRISKKIRDKLSTRKA